MPIAATAPLWFLLFAGPIAFWVALSDMKEMRIPNKAVLALLIVYAIVGVLVLPFQDYLWRWSHFAVILLIGFLMSSARMIGAGDAKFAAAMAPLIAYGDIRYMLVLFPACLLGAFAAHRLARMIPAVRRALPGWKSWENKDFPMGLALSGTLIFYLVGAVL